MQYKSYKGLLLATVALTLFSTPVIAQDNTTESNKKAESPSSTSERKTQTLDAISITASRTEKLAIDSPASISIVTEEEIERRQAETVHDLLKDLPSVELEGGTRNTVIKPSIRGLGGQRVVTRIDGARQNFNSGHKGGLFVDPALLKQVEVLRGPASTIHGTGALGGVVAFETKSADDYLEVGEKYGAQISTGFTTIDNGLHSNITGYARPLDNIDLVASVTRRKTDDYDAGDGKKRAYTDDDLASGLIKGGIDIADFHRIGLSYRLYRDDHNLPATPDGLSTSSIVERESKEDSFVFDYSYDNPDNQWFDTSIKAYYDTTDIDEVRISDGRHEERSLETLGLEGFNTSYLNLHENAELAVTVGGEVFQDTQKGKSDGAPIGGYPDAERNIYGVYLDNTLTLFENLELTAGLRYDSYSLEADGQEDSEETSTSPRFAISYRVLPFLQPYVSYAEAFRAPSLGETYASGLHFPGGGPTPNNFFVANPNLKPETAKTWEIGTNIKQDGLFREDDSLRAKVSYFRNNVDDFIELDVDAPGGTTTSSNVTKARIQGFEAEIHYDTPTVYGSLSGSRIRGKNTDTSEALSGIAGDKAALMLGYHFQSINLDLGGRALAVREQNRVPDDSDAIDGYATFDVFGSWDAVDYVPGLKINAGIDNILDKNYRRGAAVLDEPGRNFKVTASLKF